ncbi:hypothetical protein [Nocardia sp. XZ_19_369]|uniref:hypothetical protein n=1 Tax=Nocardia sp. XZ_19_369 TaxID=2769487 RepID=UPI00188FF84F|nr:hypothetical protein [Nocardia sp. XZ_19_369]
MSVTADEPLLFSPLPLGALAESAMLSMADVVFLSKLPASTLSRLWRNEHWLDRVSGATLQQLVAVLPGLAEYVTRRSYGSRLGTVLRECDEAGLDISNGRIGALLSDGPPAQHVATTLAAASSMMRLDSHGAVSNLARCWGASQDVALDALFSAEPHGLLADMAPLVEKGLQLIDILDGGTNSLHTTVGYGILVHKLTKLTGAVPADTSPHARERNSAFAYRSGTIGVLLRSGDTDASVAYSRSLDQNALLRRNELWSMTSFYADMPQSSDFSLPAKGGLHNTEAAMSRDLASSNEAYLHYLVTSAIPVLLEHDQLFGAATGEIARQLRDRLERGVSDKRVVTAGAKLLKSMP